jgi:hypothetical protein
MDSREKLHDYQMCEHAMHHSSQWSAGNLCVDLDGPILRYTRLFLWQEPHSSCFLGSQLAPGRFDTYLYGRRMDAPQPFDSNASSRQPVNVAAR